MGSIQSCSLSFLLIQRIQKGKKAAFLKREQPTQLGSLHDQLGHRPPETAQKRCAQNQQKASRVELGRFVGEHEEAGRDEQDDENQTGALLFEAEQNGEAENENDAC